MLATFTQGSDSVARTILQNVTLLAVNTSLMPTSRAQPQGQAPGQDRAGTTQPQGAEPTTTKVTIAVTPSEAERLVAAQHKGKLKIGLRGLNDASRFATNGASVNAIFGIAEQPGALVQRPTAAQQRRASVRISERRAAKLRSLPSQLPGYEPLPPFGPTLQPEPRKIRVIKGSQVQEVEVGR